MKIAMGLAGLILGLFAVSQFSTPKDVAALGLGMTTAGQIGTLDGVQSLVGSAPGFGLAATGMALTVSTCPPIDAADGPQPRHCIHTTELPAFAPDTESTR